MEEEVKKPGENIGNVTKCDQSGTFITEDKEKQKEDEERKKEEQERTRIKKLLFLEYLEKTSGVIVAVCRKVDISKMTFYRWRETDKEFDSAVRKITSNRLNDAEDLLFEKVFVEKKLRAITYFLDRKHPEYKPKNLTEVVTGEKTLEDLLDEENREIDLQNDREKREKDAAGTDRTESTDKKQEGDTGAVHAEPGTGVLLAKEDEKKHNNQSAAKGVK